MNYKKFLLQLKTVRKQKGFSLRKLGNAIGITGQYLFAIENGRSPLKMKDYISICEVLEISPCLLLNETTYKPE